jgi:hypothetical protein
MTENAKNTPTPLASTVEADPAAHMARVLTEVCFGAEEEFPLEETAARYFHPDYRQCADGEVLDYAGFLDHMKLLRSRIAPGCRVEVHEALRDGRRIADRHTVHVIKADGGQVETEVYFFAELAEDFRLVRVDEITRMVAGGAGDADLAYAR